MKKITTIVIEENENDHNFITGDVVKLKSGGTKMTVNSTTENAVWCKWFYKGICTQGHFYANAVEKAKSKT